MSTERPARRRSVGYLLAFALTLAVGVLAVVWLLAKMARTDEADLRLMLIGAVAVIGGVAFVAFGVRRGARGQRRVGR